MWKIIYNDKRHLYKSIFLANIYYILSLKPVDNLKSVFDNKETPNILEIYAYIELNKACKSLVSGNIAYTESILIKI